MTFPNEDLPQTPPPTPASPSQVQTLWPQNKAVQRILNEHYNKRELVAPFNMKFFKEQSRDDDYEEMHSRADDASTKPKEGR